MTEQDDDARIDLSAIDPFEAGAGAGLEDRVVSAAMLRVRAAPRSAMDDLARLWRPGLAAAAVFTTLAIGSLFARSTPVANDSTEADVMQWVASEHVPSNGELLVAFNGYGR
jgi:hypothetical protein